MTRGAIVAIALVAAAAGACKEREAGGAKRAVGAERGDCRPDRSCDPGLVCLSNLCVQPLPADCAKVAEALGFVFLDNYAPREERARFQADVTVACEGAKLSKDEGECLVRAKSRMDVRACPRPIGLGDCKKMTAHVEALRAADTLDPYLVTPTDRLVERCRVEVPTLAFERCVLASKTMSDVERCAW